MNVAEAISKRISKKLKHYHTAPLKGDVRHTLADISKARRLMGYENRVKFVDGLRVTDKETAFIVDEALSGVNVNLVNT